MKKYIWDFITFLALIALMLFLYLSKVDFEIKVLMIIVFYLFAADRNMKRIRTKLQEIQQEYRGTRDKLYIKSSRERRENLKYFIRLINFMRDSDTLKNLYEDGLLYDPDFVSNGKLTINLLNGMALCVKDAGYPAESPGVYINLRDAAGNEDCVVRAEFNANGNNGQGSLRVITYQLFQEDEVFDIDYLAER